MISAQLTAVYAAIATNVISSYLPNTMTLNIPLNKLKETLYNDGYNAYSAAVTKHIATNQTVLSTIAEEYAKKSIELAVTNNAGEVLKYSNTAPTQGLQQQAQPQVQQQTQPQYAVPTMQPQPQYNAQGMPVQQYNAPTMQPQPQYNAQGMTVQQYNAPTIQAPQPYGQTQQNVNTQPTQNNTMNNNQQYNTQQNVNTQPTQNNTMNNQTQNRPQPLPAVNTSYSNSYNGNKGTMNASNHTGVEQVANKPVNKNETTISRDTSVNLTEIKLIDSINVIDGKPTASKIQTDNLNGTDAVIRYVPKSVNIIDGDYSDFVKNYKLKESFISKLNYLSKCIVDNKAVDRLDVELISLINEVISNRYTSKIESSVITYISDFEIVNAELVKFNDYDSLVSLLEKNIDAFVNNIASTDNCNNSYTTLPEYCVEIPVNARIDSVTHQKDIEVVSLWAEDCKDGSIDALMDKAFSVIPDSEIKVRLIDSNLTEYYCYRIGSVSFTGSYYSYKLA